MASRSSSEMRLGLQRLSCAHIQRATKRLLRAGIRSSFEDGGEVLVSPRADRSDLRRLGFEQLALERFGFAEAPAVWPTGAFADRQRSYLDYHRSDVFVS